MFLGYVVSADGISSNPEKVGKVQNWPVPSNQKELHSFTGLGYYRCFIPKFATISKCLHELVGPPHIKKDRKTKEEIPKDSNCQWTDEHQKAFDLLKAHLTSAPVLGYLGFSHPFDLEIVASLQGLGAYVRESKLVAAQVRWLSKLALFDFDIMYRTGKLDKAAGTLSHHPYVPEEMDNNSESEQYETNSYAVDCEEVEGIIDVEKIPRECEVAIQNKENKTAQQELELHSSVIEVLSKVSPSEMIEAQQADPTIGQVVLWVKAGNKPKLSQIRKEK